MELLFLIEAVDTKTYERIGEDLKVNSKEEAKEKFKNMHPNAACISITNLSDAWDN